MKRLLFALLCAIVLPASAQLQVKSEGTANYVLKNKYQSVLKSGDSYDLIVNDALHTGTMTIHLGDTKTQALTTYEQIADFFNNSEKKASLVVQGKDGDLTLYKQNNTIWMITEGDAEYARKFFNDTMMHGLTGANANQKTKSGIPLCGYFDPGSFNKKKIMEIFSE